MKSKHKSVEEIGKLFSFMFENDAMKVTSEYIAEERYAGFKFDFPLSEKFLFKGFVVPKITTPRFWASIVNEIRKDVEEFVGRESEKWGYEHHSKN